MLDSTCRLLPVRSAWPLGSAALDPSTAAHRNGSEGDGRVGETQQQHQPLTSPRRPNLSVRLPSEDCGPRVVGADRQPLTLFPLHIAPPPASSLDATSANSPLAPGLGISQLLDSTPACLCYGQSVPVTRSCTRCSAMTAASASAYLRATPHVLLQLLRQQQRQRAEAGTDHDESVHGRATFFAATYSELGAGGNAGMAALDEVPAPLCVRLPAAVVLIDISGFTSLTESFAAQGGASGGLEALTDTVSAYFSSILTTIRAHGGDLLKVAGDALIVAFYRDGLSEETTALRTVTPLASLAASTTSATAVSATLPLLCLRALRSALALQSAPAFTAAGVTLRLHVGVTCGETDFIAVGGVEQVWTVGGQPGEAFADSHEEGDSAVFDNERGGAAVAGLRVKTEEATSPVLLSPSRPRPLSVGHRLSASFSPPSSPQSDGGSRWEFLAVGPAFDQLRSAVNDSKTGQVVCSAEVWQQATQVATLQGQQLPSGESGNWLVSHCQQCDAVATQSNAVVLASGSADDEQTAQDATVAYRPSASRLYVPPAATVPTLSSFLMPALLFRLQTRLSSPSRWLGEYRKVTVLFIALPEPTRCQLSQPTQPLVATSSQEARGSVSVASFSPAHSSSSPSSSSSPTSVRSSTWLWSFHRLVRALQRCILRMGGQVRQLVVDDKGCVMIGAFGLPPLAQEDDATRALTAALDILAASRALLPPALSSAVSIGVTTGRAWCGAVGSEARSEYAVVGDVVNLSARIMGNAATQSRALCDEESMRASDGHIKFSPTVHHVRIKGRSGLFPLFEPLGRARPSMSRTGSALPSPSGSPPAFRFSQLSRATSAAPRAHSSSSSRSTPLGLRSSSVSRGSLSASPPTSPVSASVLRSGGDITPLSSFRALGRAEAIRLSSREEALDRMCALLLPADELLTLREEEGEEHDDDEAVEQPTPPVLLLEGEPGQGKSHLTCQLMEECRAAGMLVLLGQADSMESSTPLFALAAILQDIVRIEAERCNEVVEESPSVKANQSALLSLLPASEHPYASLLLPLLPECGSLAGVPSVAVEASMRAAVVRRLLRSLIAAHCERHAHSLLIIEDGHWLDLQSWTLLREVTELLPSVRLLLTCRPLAAPDATSPGSAPPPSPWTQCTAITEHPRCQHLVLAGMEMCAATKVACWALGCTALSPSLAEIVLQRSDGIPLFILHLCSFMRDSRLVAINDATGVASLDERTLAGTSLPMSLEGLLISILDKLHPDCQLTLKVASVVGRRFSCSLVAACHPLGLTVAQVQALMTMAEHQRIVREDGLTRDPLLDDEHSLLPYDVHYRFTHQLVRDAAYTSLLFQRRRELHALVADQLVAEQQHEQQLQQHRAVSSHLLAHHYWLSLCMADDVLLECPDQRLLGCAVTHLVDAALASRQSGTPDAVSMPLNKAARGMLLLQPGKLRDVQQARWLFLLIGGELLYNMPLVVMLAVASGDAKAEEGATLVVGSRCVRTFSNRLLALLDVSAVMSSLSHSELQGTHIGPHNARNSGAEPML